MIELTLPWPPSALSPNARSHWAVLSKAKKTYREACAWTAKGQGLKPVASSRLHLSLTFYPPSRRAFDLDNCLARMKSGLDGLADVMEVDDRDWSLSIQKADQVGGFVKVFIGEAHACSVDQCEKPVRYKAACLCQMHYFRKMRNGTTEAKLAIKKRELGYSRQERVTMPGRGYQRLHLPGHPLADTQGYVSEHRKVVFDRIGYSLDSCELCGKPETWETVHIDHKDNNPKNNEPSNLRPLCRPCNTFRDYPERHSMKGNHAIELGGVILTAKEWSRVCGGYLSHNAIIRRINSGMTAEQALLTAKTTHKGEVPYTHEGLIELAKHYRAEARRLKKEQAR